jgi:hypothetical protein
VNDEYDLVFTGRTPSAGGGMLRGTWRLRTPGGEQIGDVMTISTQVYSGG